MQLTEFGKTGLFVPPIVFGTTSLGNLYLALPDEMQRQIISEWFRLVNVPFIVDSAGKYGAGLALENVGRHLKALSIPPERVLISNKLAWRRVPLTAPEPTFEPGVWVDLQYDAVQDISYDGILRCHEDGCELLGDYHPQLLSVHDPDEYLAAASSASDRTRRWDDILGAYRALNSLRDAGEVLGIGVGSKDWTVVRDIYEQQPLDWVMIANSLTLHSHPPGLLAFIQRLQDDGVAVVNSAVFNGGFLVGGRHYNYRLVNEHSEQGAALIEWRHSFERVCDQHHVDPALACVAFGKSPPGISAVALSSTKPARVASNIDLVTASPPVAFWEDLKACELIDPAYPYLP